MPQCYEIRINHKEQQKTQNRAVKIQDPYRIFLHANTKNYAMSQNSEEIVS